MTGADFAVLKRDGRVKSAYWAATIDVGDPVELALSTRKRYDGLVFITDPK